MPRQTNYFVFTLAVLASGLSCMAAEDETDEVNQGLSRNLKKIMTRVPVNGEKELIRYLEIKCPNKESDCAYPDEILLLADENATTPFPATAQGGYEGCGPQAVANVQAYVTGIIAKTWQVAQYVGRIDFPGNKYGSTPGMVIRGLAAALETNTHRYSIWGDSGPSPATDWIPGRSEGPELRDVKNHLKSGYPLVLLVDGGEHWVVATGYRSPDQLFVTDYGNSGRWVRFGHLGFDNLKKVPTSALGFDGYRKRTYITIGGIVGYQMDNPGNPNGEVANPPPSGGTCDENIRCSGGGKTVNPVNCMCMCDEAVRSECSNNGPLYTWDEGNCMCNRDPDAPVTSL